MNGLHQDDIHLRTAAEAADTTGIHKNYFYQLVTKGKITRHVIDGVQMFDLREIVAHYNRPKPFADLGRVGYDAARRERRLAQQKTPASAAAKKARDHARWLAKKSARADRLSA